MFWKSFFRRLFQNVDEKPGFQKTITVRKHLDIGGDNRHRCNADIPRHKQCMEQHEKRIESV